MLSIALLGVPMTPLCVQDPERMEFEGVVIAHLDELHDATRVL